MSVFVEFHVVQSFAPSNLNRDDTGAPKDAVFGGHRRARVSSQCFKRAIRLSAAHMDGIPPEFGSIRTKRLKSLLERRLTELGRENAGAKIESALASAGISLKEDGTTEYLLFLGSGEVEGLAQIIHSHWDLLGDEKAAEEKRSKKEAKKAAKSAAPPEVAAAARSVMEGVKAVDVALFGRMLADAANLNQDAACQVAHAISTHRVEREFDYFTAVDDLSSDGEPGAGMIGQVEFNSATYYRYAVVDLGKLVQNLQGDRELALAGIASFARGMARAVPTGKQNTFAAQNLPSFVGVVLRHSGPLSLANAFESPVWPKADEQLTALSVRRLAEHDAKLAQAYGDGRDEWGALDLTEAWPTEKGTGVRTLDELVAWLSQRTSSELGG